MDSTGLPFRVAGMNLQSSIAWMAMVVKGGASRSTFVLFHLTCFIDARFQDDRPRAWRIGRARRECSMSHIGGMKT